MRLHISENDFDGEGFGESSSPSIAAKNNAKIFYMLTTGFYSRPRESMFREICANAFDEMRHASRPFLVCLPHAMQPELVVRDWGRGMTHSFVMHRAMSLGDSTKDHDDDAIGGFGLGMKTPFCVTEQFSLVIYRGDHKQTYVIDRKDGTPRPQTDAAMIEPLEGAEQCTGTEIRIPIPEKDWREFRDIAARILQLFPADSFELIGADVSPPEYVREAASYAVLKQSSAPTYARMGCIAYRLDLEAIYGDAWQELGAPSTGMELRFPIGALSVTPNREALLLDDRTRDAVKAALETALDDFRAEFTAHIQTAATYWEACVMFARAHYEAGDASRFLPKRVQWQNAERGAYIDGIKTPSAAIAWSRGDLGRYKSPRPMSKDFQEWKPDVNRRQEPPCWVWVLDDLEPGKPKKLLDRAHLINRYAQTRGDLIRAHRVAFVDAAFIEALEMPRSAYVLASYFEPPKPLKVAKGAGYLKGKTRAYSSSKYSGRTSTRWGLCEVQLERGGVYIPFSGSSPVNPRTPSLSRVSWFKGAPILGMPRHLTKQLDPALWRNAETIAAERAARLIRSSTFKRAIMWARIEQAGQGYETRDLWERLFKYRPHCSAWNALRDKLQAYRPQARIRADDLKALGEVRAAGVLGDDIAAQYDAAFNDALPVDVEAELTAYLEARPIFAHILTSSDQFARRGLLTEYFRAALIVKEKP